MKIVVALSALVSNTVEMPRSQICERSLASDART
jgi:hypothetical protein